MASTKFNVILDLYDISFPDLADRLKCVICHSILKDARQTSCGCRACAKCIIHYLSTSPKPCPGKQHDCAMLLNIDADIYSDNATNREIGMLQVKCPFYQCNHTNLLRSMTDHIGSCEFREIICDQCQQKYIANDKSVHEANICEMRIVTCRHCNESIKYRDLESLHLNAENDIDKLCSKFIAVCPNKCAVAIKVNLKEHLVNCANKKLDCPFRSMGCNFGKMSEEVLANHIQLETAGYCSLLVDRLKRVEEENGKLHHQVDILHKMIQELPNINRISTESRLKMEKLLDDIRNRGNSANSNRHITRVPAEIAAASSTASIDRGIITFSNWSYIWKVINFKARRIDAVKGIRVSVTSDAFYTSEFGYKMCLRLYPAGYGVGEGTHLSLSFALMCGHYDDYLEWPFRQTVTLSILDQNNAKYHSHMLKPDSRSKCFQRPSDDCNIASGSPKFIRLDRLMGPDIVFCRDDTIFLKISVDTNGISRL